MDNTSSNFGALQSGMIKSATRRRPSNLDHPSRNVVRSTNTRVDPTYAVDSSPNPRPDIMIAVMGPTGTGKSSFIQLITGDENVKVGHNLSSETSDIKLANYFELDGRCVTFVDTPGFDDSREDLTDAAILQKIAAFLDTQQGRKLNGIIYMHRIIDPRMGGVCAQNLRMFRKLCGSDSLKNVAIVTTRWDSADFKESQSVPIARERELLTNESFFQPLVAAGARSFRHYNTRESARDIVLELLDNSWTELQIQKELKKGMKLEETDAGSELNKHVKALVEKHDRQMKSVLRDMQVAIAEKDLVFKRELEQGRRKLDNDRDKLVKETKILRGGLDNVRNRASAQEREAKKHIEEQRQAFLDNQAKLMWKFINEGRQQREKSDRHIAGLVEQLREQARRADKDNKQLWELRNRMQSLQSELQNTKQKGRRPENLFELADFIIHPFIPNFLRSN